METKPVYKVTNEITPYRALTPTVWNMIQAIGPAMHKARLFGVSNPEQAMAIMLKGYEMGLSLTASFEFVQVIQGKPTLSPRGMLALIQQSPLCKRIEIVDEKDACTCSMERTNGFIYSVTFTMADAQRAGLVRPDSGWEKWPANMLRWRAVGFCADVVFPDIIGGMRRADELGAEVSEEGDVIDSSEWTIIPSEEPKSPNATTIDALLMYWTPKEIMAANEGRIPATAQECLDVAAKLEGNDD